MANNNKMSSRERVLAAIRHEEPDQVSALMRARETLLIVDHYEWDADLESRCREAAGRIMIVDDLANRKHDCDLLLDQTLGRRGEDYAGLVPENCKVMAGPQFALLRPEFRAARKKALGRRNEDRDMQRLMVSLGGSAQTRLLLVILRGIALSGLDIQLDVITGHATDELEELRAAAREISGDARFATHVTDMAALMVEADLAIGAAGATSWERCCLGLPALVVVLAENQRIIASNLQGAGAVASLGEAGMLEPEKIAESLRGLGENGRERREMALAAAAVCDGRGTELVMEALAA